MKTGMFDKKFVITAIIIAFFYACLVIFINKMIGKDAAGVAGVALTALATVIFKQFETLRFKENIENPTEIIYKFSWWQVLLLAFFFAGFNFYMQEIKDYIIPLLVHTETYVPGKSYADWSLDIGIIGNQNHTIVVKDYSIWETGIECFSFFVASLIAAKSWPKISYAVIIVAALLGILLDFLREDLLDYLFKFTSMKELLSDLEDYEYSFLYVVFSFIGVYLVSYKKRRLS